MLIRIASTRAPKINGVKRAFKKISSHFSILDSSIIFETYQTESGVSDTPKSIEELISGAQQRAQSVFDKEKTAMSIGVEGGVFQIHEKVFLQSWSCVFDGKNFSFGSSGSIEIPQSLATAVMHNCADLGIVIDGFAQKNDVRSNQGTFGILTNDLITREDSFELATLNALMPFFNEQMYERTILKI
jgi:inosine/xanthosine triphosphatase